MRFLLAILLLLVAAPVSAQQGQGMSQAIVVSSCGGGASPSGALTNLTMDTTGQLCLGGTFGIASVWSAADAAANGMVLSNGGLTVTSTKDTLTWSTIRNTVSHISGKVYIEFSFTAVDVSNYVIFGVGSTGMNVSDALGASNYSGGAFSISNYVSAGFTSNYAITGHYASAGETWGLAVDFAAGNVWVAQNNVWLNGSNPATGSLPVLSFVPATVGALFTGLSFLYPGDVVLLKATAASQAYAPPSGFKAWDAP